MPDILDELTLLYQRWKSKGAISLNFFKYVETIQESIPECFLPQDYFCSNFLALKRAEFQATTNVSIVLKEKGIFSIIHGYSDFEGEDLNKLVRSAWKLYDLKECEILKNVINPNSVAMFKEKGVINTILKMLKSSFSFDLAHDFVEIVKNCCLVLGINCIYYFLKSLYVMNGSLDGNLLLEGLILGIENREFTKPSKRLKIN